MQHLFSEWEPLAAAVKTTPHVLLLSDYDGTLTPIVSRPEEAVLSTEARDRLHALCAKPGFSIGIVSGRSLAECKAMVGVGGIYYAGNHGFEIEGPGLRFVNPEAEAARSELKKIAGAFSDKLGGVRGAIVEDKGLSLSLHYRLVSGDDLDTVSAVFRQITSPLVGEGKIRVTAGKKVWEVRPPVDWHKGRAVEAIVKEIKKLLGLEQLLTIYLGDDTTDEDAFRVLRRPQGWSIFVGGENPSSYAGYFLNSTTEVLDFLSRLLEMR